MVDYPKTHVTMRYYAPHTIEFGEHVLRTKEGWRPFWACDCGADSSSVWSTPTFKDTRPSIERFIDAATKHSRTHAVERVKNYLYFLTSQAKERHSPRSSAYEEAAQIVEKYLC